MSSCKIRISTGNEIATIQVFLDSTWQCIGNTARNLPRGRANGHWVSQEGMSHYPRLVLYDNEQLPVFILRNCAFPTYGDARGKAVCCWQPNAWKYSQTDPDAYVQSNADWNAVASEQDFAALEAEIEASRQEMRDLAIQIGLDVAGAIDPTPISDLTSAGFQLKNKEILGAGLTLLGVIPYLGDVGKLVKAPWVAARLAKVEKRLEKAVHALRVTQDQLATVRRNARKLAERYYFGVVNASELAAQLVKDLPLFRNPRWLKKHPGPIKPEALLDELAGKGFVQIKVGKHVMPPGFEDSDIWLRKVVHDGKEKFESVRIDYRPKNPANDRRVLKDGTVRDVKPDKVQASDKPQRQIHNWFEDGADAGDKLDAIQSGKAFKGDFSHWHHEMFDATESNLAIYMAPPVKDAKGVFIKPSNIQKYDSTGQVVSSAK